MADHSELLFAVLARVLILGAPIALAVQWIRNHPRSRLAREVHLARSAFLRGWRRLEPASLALAGGALMLTVGFAVQRAYHEPLHEWQEAYPDASPVFWQPAAEAQLEAGLSEAPWEPLLAQTGLVPLTGSMGAYGFLCLWLLLFSAYRQSSFPFGGASRFASALWVCLVLLVSVPPLVVSAPPSLLDPVGSASLFASLAAIGTLGAAPAVLPMLLPPRRGLSAFSSLRLLGVLSLLQLLVLVGRLPYSASRYGPHAFNLPLLRHAWLLAPLAFVGVLFVVTTAVHIPTVLSLRQAVRSARRVWSRHGLRFSLLALLLSLPLAAFAYLSGFLASELPPPFPVGAVLLISTLAVMRLVWATASFALLLGFAAPSLRASDDQSGA